MVYISDQCGLTKDVTDFSGLADVVELFRLKLICSRQLLVNRKKPK